MTLPNHSRRLTVDTTSYRFLVTKRAAPCLNVTIEVEAFPGRCLVATVDVRRCDAIGTTEVEALVRRGVLAGWAPGAGGPGPFRLDPDQIDDALVSVGR
jgi:hypothetical protein